jgi:hypothetical protein
MAMPLVTKATEATVAPGTLTRMNAARQALDSMPARDRTPTQLPHITAITPQAGTPKTASAVNINSRLSRFAVVMAARITCQ